MKTFANSVKFAFKGLRVAWAGRNFRIQVLMACLVTVCGAVFGITPTEWLVVSIFTALVLSAEIVNTAIEHIVNMISPEFNPTAGKIKDLAAGAVLVLAFFSALAGLLIFTPYIIKVFIR